MGRSPCCSKEAMKRGAWTQAEDQILINHVKVHGEGKWSSVPKKAGLRRCGKSCRLRWMNYLRPNIKRGNITPDEEELIIRLHKLLGNRWSLIAGRLPGRTDNEIKNYWNTNIVKKAQQIQPSSKSSQHHNPSSTPPSPIDISQEERELDEENGCLNNLSETRPSMIEPSISLFRNINADDKTQDDDHLRMTNDLEKNNDSSNSTLNFDVDENLIANLFHTDPLQPSDYFVGDIIYNMNEEVVLSPNSTKVPQVGEEDHDEGNFNYWLATFLDCDIN